jgi:hypothetical protein
LLASSASASPAALELPAAEAYGSERANAGASAADVAREALRALAALEEGEGPAQARLRELGAEATARAVAGWEAARRDRREGWLSYLVHDLKNPLNTVLNAVWLLRGKIAQKEDLDKLLRMIERAAKKIEIDLAEVRDLENKHVAGWPPGKKGK